MTAKINSQMRDLISGILERSDLQDWQKCSEIHKITARHSSPLAVDIQRSLLFVNGLLGGWSGIVLIPEIWTNYKAILGALEGLTMQQFVGILRGLSDVLMSARVDVSSSNIMKDVAGMYKGEEGDIPSLRLQLESAVSRSGCNTHEQIMGEFILGLKGYFRV